MQATAQCAATFVRAVGRPNNDPLDRELHRCIAEERDVARFTAALGHFRPIERGFAVSGYPPKTDIETGIYEYTPQKGIIALSFNDIVVAANGVAA